MSVRDGVETFTRDEFEWTHPDAVAFLECNTYRYDGAPLKIFYVEGHNYIHVHLWDFDDIPPTYNLRGMISFDDLEKELKEITVALELRWLI